MSKHTDFSRIFIDRPILATVLSTLILVAGIMAIPNLPISEYPDVVPPSVQVTATYPGANPRTIADTVAGPIEEVVNGVENMIYMKSTASADGQMQLTVTFKGGTDIDLAAMQVQNRVQQAVPRLPEAVRTLGVTVVKASPNLTMVVHLDSPNKTYDALYLSNFANLRVRDELARLPGVGQAIAFGAGNYAMRVWIAPERAAARSLSAADIVGAIREQNVQVSAGALGGPPTPEGSALQVSINAQGRLASPEAFGNIILKAEGAELTRLKDVARIELGSNNYAIRSLLNNDDAAAIVIFEAPGANTVALSNAIRARMQELEGSFPEDLHWSVVYDPTVFVRDSIASVVETLLEAIALVVIVVVLFLQTWRASLIPLVAVPVSIVGTFAVLWLLGFSVNVLTLFGLVLAIGIVVDDAIVVVENIERHIEAGETPREAAHNAMSEVSGPIVAITLVLASVFVPLAFLGGVTGQFYRQFAVTIAAAVIISGFNSLTLSPALAALLLQPHGAPKDALGRRIERVFGRPFAAFNRMFKRFGDRYSGGIGGTISRAPRLLVIYAVLIVVAVLGFRAVQGGYIPTQDKQFLFSILQLPEAANIDRTDKVMRRMGDIAMQVPGVENVVQFPGLNAVHFVATPNTGVMFIGLEPSEHRELKAAEIAMRINMAYGGIQDGLAFALMPPPVLGLGNANGIDFYVEDRNAIGYGELYGSTTGLIGALGQTEGFDPMATFTSYQANVPQLDAVVNRTKVKELGLALTDVYNTLQVYLGSAYVNDFDLDEHTYRVYVQADAAFRRRPENLRTLHVRSASGAMIPLDNLVRVHQGTAPQVITHFNLFRSAEIAMRINMAYGQIQDGLAFALMPPPVLGLGNANGIDFYVEDRNAIGYGELY
ncbi:MAG TPA: efflux RND transporter permease subunit, partial [Solirubrobacter sp.]|nr:efflux RND transporter permease subunit [Solirubrobacter sp.]